MTRVFIDTWGWIAILSRKDEHHAATVSVMREVAASLSPIYTSWAVISELMTVASGRRGREAWGKDAGNQVADLLREWVDDSARLREVITPTSQQWRAALDVRGKHAGLPDLSLVDCTTALLCAERQIGVIVSGDSDLRTIMGGVHLLPADGWPPGDEP